jgi:hypothetical protein
MPDGRKDETSGKVTPVSVEQLKARIRREMELAHTSRLEGREGRARVCARRAAGWAVSSILPGDPSPSERGNAYEALRWLQQQEILSDSVRDAAVRLTTRLTAEHRLPFDEDPLQDAERVIELVFREDWREFPAMDVLDGKEDAAERGV